MKRLAAASAAMMLAVMACTCPVTAHADPVDSTGSNLISISWDGPATNVAWDCTTYESSESAEGTFVGVPVTVPGDRIERTATVKNNGPSDAVVTVQIINVGKNDSTDTVNQELEDIIHLFWNINGIEGDVVWSDAHASANADGVSYSVSFLVAKGTEFSIKTGYYFPIEATGGRNLGNTSSLLSFDIRVLMQGVPDPTDPPHEIKTGGGLASGWYFPWQALVLIFGGAATIAGMIYRRTPL